MFMLMPYPCKYMVAACRLAVTLWTSIREPFILPNQYLATIQTIIEDVSCHIRTGSPHQ